MKQSNVARQWDMFIQGTDCRERDRKESLASLPFRREREIFKEFISGLFHGDPRGREDTSFVGRGPGPPACRAYRASFLPLDWSAPSNWRSRRKRKVKRKEQTRRSAGARKAGRKREADEEERSEWREEKERERAAVCCRHANSCWTATWKGLVGSSDLTAQNLVSDTINIGPGELSQSRGSLSAASRVNPVDLKYPLCGFFSLVNHAVSVQPLFY